MTQYSQLEKQLNYQFKNQALLKLALTHKSYSKNNYERLEFVGDGILDYVIALNLYNKYPDLPEGDLSKMRANLVNQDSLVEIALMINLGQHLILGDGENKSGGRKRPSILADVLEAIFAAISLDSNVQAAINVIEHLFANKLDAKEKVTDKDSKSQLQEYLQARSLSLPEYEVIKVTGPDHDSTFEVKCSIADLNISVVATGKTKKAASQNAAAQILTKV